MTHDPNSTKDEQLPLTTPILGVHLDGRKTARARQLRRAMTAAESILWRELRGNRLGNLHFRRQQVIEGFIVDFYCHAARLAVEVDGVVHKSRSAADRERDQVLAARGIEVRRYGNSEVEDRLPSVLQDIVVRARARL